MAYFQEMNATDTEDFFTVFRYVNNTASDGLFFPIILLVIWFVAVLGTVISGRHISRAWTFGSFVCSILSILLVLMNFLEPSYMYFCFFLTAVGVVWVRLANAPS